MSKLQLLASKEIWDETNPLPCVRISFLSDFSDGAPLIDWEKWVDYVDTEYNTGQRWMEYSGQYIDYERSLEGANKYVLLDFIEWL